MEYSPLVVATHGLFLKTFFKEMMNIDIKKVGDGAFVLIEERSGEITILSEEGIEHN